MRTQQDLRHRLGIEYPIIQAPMAGATTPELVAAVSNAGGLGMIGAAYFTPAQITEAIERVRALTTRPFGINLFAGGRDSAPDVDPGPALALVARYHAELGLPAPEPPSMTPDPFPAQLASVLAARVPVFSFTFGVPSQEELGELSRQEVAVLGTATTVSEAQHLATAGVDAVVVQGSEAGAHRGTFAAPFDAAMIGTMALVPQVVDAISLPVIASGGIMDGRGIVAAEALGASAVQMGTAFLTCEEAGVPAAHKAAIRAAQGEETAITHVFSGRPARGIVNEFIRAWDGQHASVLPFPLQNAATRALRSAAATNNDARLLSLWSGQAGRLARDVSAATLVRQLVDEVAAVRAKVGTPWE